LHVADDLIDIPACKHNIELICSRRVFLWTVWLN